MSALAFVKASAKPKFKPSPLQTNFFDWVAHGTGSCVLEAVAGSGKTTTLCEAIKLMEGSVFFGAFSKKIAEELQARIGHLGIANISTFHAAGLAEWRTVSDKFLKIDGNKCRDIFRNENWQDIASSVLEGPVLQLVSYAKQAAFGVAGFPPIKDVASWENLIAHFGVETFNEKSQVDNKAKIIQLAQETYEASLKMCKKMVDFDDMLLAPLFFSVSITKYDWILIDEAQDTNACRRELAMRMMEQGSRLVAVGDRRQAIFGFTGADSDALDRIAEETNAVRMPLNVSFRCPKLVVQEARRWVTHIEAHADAKDGIVSHMTEREMGLSIKVGEMVVCRYNAPLVKQAFQLIMRGTPARVEGREIGAGIKALVNRWKVADLGKLLDRMDAYMQRETEKLFKRDQLAAVDALVDRVSCARVIVERVRSINSRATQLDVCKEIDRLFGDIENDRDPANRVKAVLLSSIHKAKGLENPVVYWLQTKPSPYAVLPWQQEQENHLCYVAATRAMSELHYVELEQK